MGAVFFSAMQPAGLKVVGIQQDTIAAKDVVKLGWKLTQKVKLTWPGCTELPVVSMRQIFASVGAVFLAKREADAHRSGGIVLGSHLGANRPAFHRAAVTVSSPQDHCRAILLEDLNGLPSA